MTHHGLNPKRENPGLKPDCQFTTNHPLPRQTERWACHSGCGRDGVGQWVQVSV